MATAPGGGVSRDADERVANGLLTKFLFPAKRRNELVAKLSGGERRRLQMLRVLARQPNFLLLDEPTNDLDLDTIGALEDFLMDEFAGVLLVVSHDRYFLDKVVDHLFVLPGDGVGEVRHGGTLPRPPAHSSSGVGLATQSAPLRPLPASGLHVRAQVLDWQSSFSGYLDHRAAEEEERRAREQQAEIEDQRRRRQEQEEQARGERDGVAAEEGAATDAATGAASTTETAAASSKPLSAFEVKQMARLEAEIEEHQQAQKALQAQISGFDEKRNGYAELASWTEEIERLDALIEVAEGKWLVLAERADL